MQRLGKLPYEPMPAIAGDTCAITQDAAATPAADRGALLSRPVQQMLSELHAVSDAATKSNWPALKFARYQMPADRLQPMCSFLQADNSPVATEAVLQSSTVVLQGGRPSRVYSTACSCNLKCGPGISVVSVPCEPSNPHCVDSSACHSRPHGATRATAGQRQPQPPYVVTACQAAPAQLGSCSVILHCSQSPAQCYTGH